VATIDTVPKTRAELWRACCITSSRTLHNNSRNEHQPLLFHNMAYYWGGCTRGGQTYWTSEAHFGKPEAAGELCGSCVRATHFDASRVFLFLFNPLVKEGRQVITAVVMKGYNAVRSYKRQPTFRRNMSPPSSGWKNKPNNELFSPHLQILQQQL
jgi:hypothetical protein